LLIAQCVCGTLLYRVVVLLHMVAVVGLSSVRVVVLQYNRVASSVVEGEQCVAIVVAISDLLSVAAPGGCGELNFICVNYMCY